jgi:hypothetical protein
MLDHNAFFGKSFVFRLLLSGKLSAPRLLVGCPPVVLFSFSPHANVAKIAFSLHLFGKPPISSHLFQLFLAMDFSSAGRRDGKDELRFLPQGNLRLLGEAFLLARVALLLSFLGTLNGKLRTVEDDIFEFGIPFEGLVDRIDTLLL